MRRSASGPRIGRIAMTSEHLEGRCLLSGVAPLPLVMSLPKVAEVVQDITAPVAAPPAHLPVLPAVGDLLAAAGLPGSTAPPTAPPAGIDPTAVLRDLGASASSAVDAPLRDLVGAVSHTSSVVDGLSPGVNMAGGIVGEAGRGGAVHVASGAVVSGPSVPAAAAATLGPWAGIASSSLPSLGGPLPARGEPTGIAPSSPTGDAPAIAAGAPTAETAGAAGLPNLDADTGSARQPPVLWSIAPPAAAPSPSIAGGPSDVAGESDPAIDPPSLAAAPVGEDLAALEAALRRLIDRLGVACESTTPPASLAVGALAAAVALLASRAALRRRRERGPAAGRIVPLPRRLYIPDHT